MRQVYLKLCGAARYASVLALLFSHPGKSLYADDLDNFEESSVAEDEAYEERSEESRADLGLLNPVKLDSVDDPALKAKVDTATQSLLVDYPLLSGEDLQTVLLNAIGLRNKVVAYAVRRRKEVSDLDFRAALSGDKIMDSDPRGRSEVNTINGRFFERVVDSKSGVALLFIDLENGIDFTSKHFLRYLSRQYHVSDGGRGRDVVLVLHRKGLIQDAMYCPRPRVFSKRVGEWFTTYGRAHVHKPEWGDLKLAVVCSLLQGSCTYGVYALKSLIRFGMHDILSHPAVDTLARLGRETSYQPALFTVAYALGIGVIIKTYTEFLNSGRPVGRVLKKTLLALPYAYAIKVLAGQGAALCAICLGSFESLILHGHIMSNVLIGNFVARYRNDLSKLYMDARLHVASRKDPLKRDPSKIDRAMIIQQSIYMISYLFKMLDLAQLPYQMGRITLILSMPGFQYVGVKYSLYKMNHAENEPARLLWERHYREKLHEWEHSWGNPIQFVRDAHRKLKGGVVTAKGSLSQARVQCTKLLEKLSE